MNRCLSKRNLVIVLTIGWLAGCGDTAPDASDATPASAEHASVAVTVAAPRQQTFHDTVEAWGSFDPQYPIAVNLPHGGQVADLNVAPGQAVRRGDRLLTVSPDPAARSAFRQAQSAATLAAGDLKRAGQLAAERLATQSQLATARKALADAQAALEAQRALGGGIGDEAVKAPLDGVVTAVNVKLGERFAANAPLLSFTPASTLLAQLGVQPDDGGKLRVGMPVQLHGVYGNGLDLVGKLSMVGQAIDPQTHLLPALADVPVSAASAPVAGTALAATIQTAAYRAWAVPRAAVLHDQRGDYLFQVEHDQVEHDQIEHDHAKRIDVKLRSPTGDTIGVQGPLDAQASVIVLGGYELNDGDAVTQQSAQKAVPAKPSAQQPATAKTQSAAAPGQPQ